MTDNMQAELNADAMREQYPDGYIVDCENDDHARTVATRLRELHPDAETVQYGSTMPADAPDASFWAAVQF